MKLATRHATRIVDEIAAPLGLDVYIRLPEEIPNSRLATLAPPSPFKMLLDFPIHLTLAGFMTNA